MAKLSLSGKELSVSGYVWSSAENEGKGGVWLHRCVSSALCTEYKKRQKTWRSFVCPRNNYQYLAMCEHQLTEAGKRGVWLHRCVYLRPYVLNIKRGRKHGEALLVPRKNYQYLAMCEHQL
jgi:hypothetical protein